MSDLALHTHAHSHRTGRRSSGLRACTGSADLLPGTHWFRMLTDTRTLALLRVSLRNQGVKCRHRPPEHPSRHQLGPGMQGEALGCREQLWDGGSSSGMEGAAPGWKEQLWDGEKSSGMQGAAPGWREEPWDRESSSRMESAALRCRTAPGFREQLWDAESSPGIQGTAPGCREQPQDAESSSGMQGTAPG